MSTSTIVPRPQAVLLLKKNRILPLLAAAKGIGNAMSAAAAVLPAPIPSLVILQGQTSTLESTQLLVSSGSRGAATAARNAARDALWISLKSEKSYVQSVVDTSPAEDGISIIKSAGFEVAAPPRLHSKPILAAKLTITSGAVRLVANAGALANGSRKRPTYNWEYSLDGGLTWVPLPYSITAATTVAGLPLLTTCSFRVSVTLGNEMQPWSQVVTLLVH